MSVWSNIDVSAVGVVLIAAGGPILAQWLLGQSTLRTRKLEIEAQDTTARKAREEERLACLSELMAEMLWNIETSGRGTTLITDRIEVHREFRQDAYLRAQRYLSALPGTVQKNIAIAYSEVALARSALALLEQFSVNARDGTNSPGLDAHAVKAMRDASSDLGEWLEAQREA